MNQEDKWFEQASNYLTEHDIRLPDDKKLHVFFFFTLGTITLLLTVNTSFTACLSRLQLVMSTRQGHHYLNL